MNGGRRWWIRGVVGVAMLAVGIGGFFYWRHLQRYVSTDDAYVGAHVVHVAAQVSGQVLSVAVRENAKVQKGQLLFEIDPRPFANKLRQARVQLAMAEQEEAENAAAVQQAQAAIEQRKADLTEISQKLARDRKLLPKKIVSAQTYDSDRARQRAARAALAAARARLTQARAALGPRGRRNVSVRQARAKIAAAELDLSYTRVTAPTSGTVSDLSLRPGSVVTAQQPLFALVGDHDWWIQANIKETEVGRIHRGEKAQVTIDAYPDHAFHGEVESLSAGAGTAFSLLPPENATGNWVKVTQRVPVRVRITDAPASGYPLRIGISGEVSIRTPG